MTNLFFDSLDNLIAVASERAVQQAVVWKSVVSGPAVELADGEHKVLFAIDESRFDLGQVLLNLASRRDYIVKLIWHRRMPTFSLNCYFKTDDSSHHWSTLNSYLTLWNMRHIVKAIDLINRLKCTLLYHWLCPTWTFLSRLKHQSYF